jgi:predicted  nucleic acid-binding Zn-ribbon protein
LRTTQRLCKEIGLAKYNNKYIVTEADFERLKIAYKKHQLAYEYYSEQIAKANDKQANELSQDDEAENELITEYFTPEDYTEFQKRLIEYTILHERIGDLKNEVQYLRTSLDKQAEQMNVLLNSFNNTIASIRERNAIDYKKQNNED